MRIIRMCHDGGQRSVEVTADQNSWTHQQPLLQSAALFSPVRFHGSKGDSEMSSFMSRERMLPAQR